MQKASHPAGLPQGIGHYRLQELLPQLNRIECIQGGLQIGSAIARHRTQAHRLLTGRFAIVVIGSKNAQHMRWMVAAVKIGRHGLGMFAHLDIGKAGIDAVDQIAGAGADAREQACDEIGVVAVVVSGIGKNVDKGVGALQAPAGQFPVGVGTAGAGVDVGRIEQEHIGRQMGLYQVDRIARCGELLLVNQGMQRAAERVCQGVEQDPMVFVTLVQGRQDAPVQSGPAAGR